MIELKVITEEDWVALNNKVANLEKKFADLLDEKVSKSPVKDYLTVREFIELIGVSRSTFENMKKETEAGRFRVDFRKRGRKVFVPSTEVERFFNQN